MNSPRAPGSLLSVIIPALDEAQTLGKLLADLQSRNDDGEHGTEREVEIILVDGGSKDHTTAIARDHGVRVLHSEPGRARQMNAGAAVATGRLLWFLHADTRLPAKTLRSLLALARGDLSEPPLWGRCDIRLSGSHPAFLLIERSMNLRSCLSGICTGDQGIFVSRSLFEAIGGFPEQPLMEDIELSKRLRQHTRPMCLHETLNSSSRYWEQHGIARSVLRMWRLRLAYFLGTPAEDLHRQYYRRHA